MDPQSRKEVLNVPPPLLGKIWPLRFAGLRRMQMHRHDEPEANLILAGRARYVVKDRRYDLEPGTLLWLLPEQDHLLVDQSPGFAMWILVFRPAPLASLCSTPWAAPLLAGDSEAALCCQLDTGTLENLARLCQQAHDARNEDTAYFNAALGHAAMAMWHAHQQAQRRPATMAVHPAVEQAARLLRDDDPSLSLDELGDRVHLSPARLSRLFGRQMGIPLSDYRNRQRIDRFFRVYATGRRHTLLSAALAAGFGSYPQFHRVFKAVMQCSPAAYRRQVRGEGPGEPLPAGEAKTASPLRSTRGGSGYRR